MILALGVILTLLPRTAQATTDLSPLRALPVLDGGRVKPIDTAARESVRLITGREKFRGWDPLALCLAIERDPLAWETQELIHVPYLELRDIVGLNGENQHSTPAAIRSSEKLRTLVSDAAAKKQAANATGELARLSRLEERALELSERLHAFDELAGHHRFAITPSKPGNDDNWLTPAELPTDAPLFVAVSVAWSDLLKASGTEDGAHILAATQSLGKGVARIADNKGSAIGPESYANVAALEREVAYHQWHPFRWAWVIYLLALATLCVSLVARGGWVYRAGMGLFVLGIVWSAVAFGWRCSITGWAPVTNIYETVVWVALVGSVVAVALEYFGRSTIPAIAGAVAATVSGVVADVMPPEYGGAIRTLTPVLRSNLWLTIHVLTIVSSYAAFMVALVLGNIVLGQFAWRPQKREAISLNLKHLYRATQIGVLLVATGTILGGLWADVSWGRFWGWDPKEVWALIILLVYLALLHGRFAGWIGQWGLAAGAVVCFLAVLMSWYGVNFILGAGLHSYGFNTGGGMYVAIFTGAQVGYVALAFLAHRKNVASQSAFEIKPAGAELAQ